MDIATNKNKDSTTSVLSTYGGTVRSRYFFSLKWKVAISLTLFLLASNAGLAYLGYINFERQFTNQLQRSVERSNNVFNSLLTQARTNLQNLGESLVFDAGDDDKAIEKLSERLQNNWDVTQLNWGLVSAALFDAKGAMLSAFGDTTTDSDDAALIQAASEQSTPATAVRCETHCLLVAAIPVLLKSGDLHILMLKASIVDLIIDFSRGNADGSVLLSRNVNPSNSGPWGYRIEAATQRERDQRLLSQATTKSTIAQLLHNGLLFEASDGRTYRLHAIAIDSRFEKNEKNILVLIDDISEQRDTINSHIYQHVAAATVGMIALEALLLFILWKPMQRITRQSGILPRLAHGDFLHSADNAPSVVSHISHDELDVLEDASFELSRRLQALLDENQQRANSLEYMALYDHLTGLANRRLFIDHLTQATHEYERSRKQFAVLFFDLDNFKRINDSFGHDVGDELLKQVARRLTENTRSTDTVARLSGDEFTVLLQHIDSPDTLLHIVEKIRLALQIPVTVSATQIMVTPSIGIVMAPDNGLDPDQLLRNADVAMYEAKRAGGNGYYFFTDEINQRASQLLRLENELREALDKQQFFLVYQPLVDLFSMRIIGLEALARWKHPEHGILAPDKFIEVMEGNGMIIELGAQVIAQACRDLVYLSEQNPSFNIAINLSPRQLHDQNLIRTLEQQLRKNLVDPRQLKVEITENSLIEDADENIEILNQLKEMGLTLSIDDFGTGYSSLSYLKMLPVDELKIDRKFISDINIDRDDREITTAVIAMAHNLQLKVVAEGIESGEQLDFLRRNHCDIGQGYLFSKPVPLETIQQMLKEGVTPLRCGT
ncbi:MAG TPA: EAL domain-containing protein [Spongiibacteraceae bacterium]|nr:EAL domain-containing protein [Spongiibacteraceae bacterium]